MRLLSPAFLIFMSLMFIMGATTANAACPGEDGPIASVHSAVKKPTDAVILSWTLPTTACDGSLLEAEFALTNIELYVSLNAPVIEAMGPIQDQIPPTATTATLQVPFPDVEKGTDVYYALRACSAHGCSPLSNQEYVKIPGNPNSPGQLTAD
jgi:hypothetical protein